MMLEQVLQISREMVAVIEAGDSLEQLDSLETERKSILVQCTDHAEYDDDQLQSEAEVLFEIVELNGLIMNEVNRNRLSVRSRLVDQNKNQKKLKAYH